MKRESKAEQEIHKSCVISGGVSLLLPARACSSGIQISSRSHTVSCSHAVTHNRTRAEQNQQRKCRGEEEARVLVKERRTFLVQSNNLSSHKARKRRLLVQELMWSEYPMVSPAPDPQSMLHVVFRRLKHLHLHGSGPQVLRRSPNPSVSVLLSVPYRNSYESV